jgi:hypothetical protein
MQPDNGCIPDASGVQPLLVSELNNLLFSDHANSKLVKMD